MRRDTTMIGLATVLAVAVALCGAQTTNNNPQFSPGGDVRVDQDTGGYTGAWATGINDGDGGGQSLQFSVRALTPQLFNRQPTLSVVSGDLDFRPANGQTGSSIVEAQLNDDGVQSCPTCTCSPSDCTKSRLVQFRISVRFVNQPPSFENAGDVTVDMNSGTKVVNDWAFNIQRGPNNPDENRQTLTWSVSNPTNPSLFRQPPSVTTSPSGQLRFEPAPDQFGFDTFTVTLEDSDGATFTAQLRVTVNFVNQPPYFTPGPAQIQVDEDSGAGSMGWATNINPGSTAETTQQVRFITEWTNPSCEDIFDRQPTIAPNGTISWTVAPDMDTIQFSCLLRVQLEDDDAQDQQVSCAMPQCGTIEFIVVPVNDVPFFVPGPNITVWEDLKNELSPPTPPSSAAVVDWVRRQTPGNDHEEDAHGQTVRYVVEPDYPDMFHVLPTVDSTGTLRFTLNPQANGQTTMRVTIFDSEDMQGNTEIVTLDVLPVNNKPVFEFAVTVPVKVPQNCGPQHIPVFLRDVNPGTDFARDEQAAQRMMIQAGVPSQPELFKTAPTITFNGRNAATLSFECATGKSGTSNQTVVLSDDGGTVRSGEDKNVQLFDIIIVPDIVPPTFNFESTRVERIEGHCDPGCMLADFVQNIISGTPTASSEVTFTVTTAEPSLFVEPPSITPAGTLTFKTTPGVDGVSLTTVRARSTESGRDSAASLSFEIAIVPVNTAPSFRAGQAFIEANAIDECRNTAAGCVHSFSGWARDVLKGRAGSTAEDGQQLTFLVTVPVAQQRLFTSSGISVDPISGTLSFTLVNNGGHTNGDAFTVPISLRDDGGTLYGGVDTFTTSIEMAVRPFQNPPSSAVMPSISIYQDAGATHIQNFLTTIDPGYLTPGTDAAAALTFSVAASDQSVFHAVPTVQMTSGTTASLDFAANDFVSGLYTLTTTIRSSVSGKSIALPCTLLIAAYNHAPTFTLVTSRIEVNRNADAATTPIARDVSAGPGRENAEQTVTFSISCDDGQLLSSAPSISADGQMSFQPAADRTGSTACTILAKDDGGTTTRAITGLVPPASVDTSQPRTVVIAVIAIPSAPSFVADSSVQSYQRQGLVALANFARSIDTGNPNAPQINSTNVANFRFEVSCSATSGLSSAGMFDVAPNVDPRSGALTFATSATVFGLISCTATLRNLIATDSTLAVSSPHTFTMDVLQVNTPPSFDVVTNTIITEYSATTPVHTVAQWATNVQGGDANPTLSFASTVLSGASSFRTAPSVALSSGELSYALTSSAAGDAAVRVCMVATGGRWITEPGVVSSVASNTSVCETINFLIRIPTSPPSLYLSRTSVTALENGQLQGDSTTSDRTVRVDRFVVRMEPGSVAAKSDNPGFVSSSVECGQCSANNVTVPSSSLLESATIAVQEDDVLTTSSLVTFVGHLTLVSRADVFGQCTACTVRATDTAGAEAVSPSFTYTLAHVNQAPTFSIAGVEASAMGSTDVVLRAAAGSTASFPQWVTSVQAGPASESAQQLMFIFTPTTSAAASSMTQLPYVGGRELRFVIAPDAPRNSAIAFRVSLRDNGGTANGGVDEAMQATAPDGSLVTVSLVLQIGVPAVAPSFEGGANLTVVSAAEPKSVTVRSWLQNVRSNDEPESQLSAAVTASPASLFAVQPVVSLPSGDLTFTVNAGAAGSVLLSVLVSSDASTEFGGVTTASTTGYLSIEALPRSPALELSALEVAAGDFFSGSITMNLDAGSPATDVSFSFSGCVPSVLSNVAAHVNGSVSFNVSESASGTASCTWTLTSGAGSITASHTVTVAGLTRPPTGSLAAAEITLAQGTSGIITSFDGTIEGGDSPATVSGALTLVAFATNIMHGNGASTQSVIAVAAACNDTTAFMAAPNISRYDATVGMADVTLPLSPTFFGVLSCSVSLRTGTEAPALLPFIVRVLWRNIVPTFSLVSSYADVNFGAALDVAIAEDVSPGSAREEPFDTVVSFEVSQVSALPATLTFSGCFTVLPRVVLSGTTARLVAAAAFTAGKFNVSIVAVDGQGARSPPRFITLSTHTDIPGSFVSPGRPYVSVTLDRDITSFSQAQFRELVADVMASHGSPVSASEVHIISVRSGSVIVDFRFERSGATDPEEDTLLAEFPRALQAGSSEATAFVRDLAVQSATPMTPGASTPAPGGARAPDGVATSPSSEESKRWWEEDWVAYLIIALLVLVVIVVIAALCVCLRRKPSDDDTATAKKKRSKRHGDVDQDALDAAPAPRQPVDEFDSFYPVKTPQRPPAGGAQSHSYAVQPQPQPQHDSVWVDVYSDDGSEADVTAVSPQHQSRAAVYGSGGGRSFAQPARYRPER